MMTISDRIFERLDELKMTQKEFSEKTGILQSTISEWKKNKTNPSSDKIMSVCLVLDVSPEWLLSGVEAAGSRLNRNDCYIIDKTTEAGQLIEAYNKMKSGQRARLMGYAEAFADMTEEQGE